MFNAIVSSSAFPAAALAMELNCPAPSTVAVEATPGSAAPTLDVAFPEDDIDITVFAAASLTDAFEEITDAIEAAHPNIAIVLETAGSQTLVTQLSEGAQADVLATADVRTMRQAQDQQLVSGEPSLFATNRLVVVIPEDNPAGIVEIRDLTGNDLRLVIAGVEVPAGRYAHQAFCDWAGNDSDALAAIGENVVSEEVDVRGVMAKVQFGEADAGVVYASDAAASELAGVPLNVIEFPEDIWTLASYPIAPVTGGDHDAAQAFISFVLSEDGQNILERYGFRQPS